MLFSLSYYQKIVTTILLTLLVSACQPAKVKPTMRWQQAIDGAYAGDISDDAHYSVYSSLHHGVSFWDLKKNLLKFTWSLQQNNADNVILLTKIAHDNSTVLTANRTDFALWDVTTGKSIGYWRVNDSNIRDIAVANKGKQLLIGKANGKVEHITLATGRRLEFLGHKEKINSVDMLPNGRVAISGGNDFIAYVWDTKTGQIIYRFNHPNRVVKVLLDKQGRFAFTADSKKTANIWDLKTGKLISTLQFTQRQEIFSSARFSKDGKFLVTGSPSRFVNIWQVSTGKRLTKWQVSRKEANYPTGAVVYSVVFGDNKQGKHTVYTVSSSGYTELWQIPQ
jgi:WD40 repeat protein